VAPPITTNAPATTATAIQTGNTVNAQLPGYQNSLATIGGNISSEVAGQLPPDVIRQIQQSAAERGVSTGSPGSDNSNASYLQSLGLNSLQLQQTGQQNLQSILPSLPGAAISQNPNFYVNPEQQYTRDLTSNIYQSSPDPTAAAQAGLAAVKSGVSAGAGSAPPSVGFGSPASNDWLNRPWDESGPSAGPVYGGGGASADTSSNTALLNGIINSYQGTVIPNWGGESEPFPASPESSYMAGADDGSDYPGQ
jgi:hypothetical protein